MTRRHPTASVRLAGTLRFIENPTAQANTLDAGIADQPDGAGPCRTASTSALRSRTSTGGLSLAGRRRARGQLLRRRRNPIERVPVGPFQRDDPRCRLERPRSPRRAGRVDRLRDQGRPLPNGHEAVGMLQDLHRAGEDVLLLGPEETVEDLLRSGELDLELDPAGKVGGDLPGDGVDAAVAIRTEPAGDGAVVLHARAREPRTSGRWRPECIGR